MKVISICNSFATRIWGEDLDKPSDKFDNCGFTEYWNDSAVVIPSSVSLRNISIFSTIRTGMHFSRNLNPLSSMITE